MATRVYESAIIEAPIDRVWAAVKPVDFHFLKSVSKHSLLDKANANTVGGVREILYKDNTKQSLRLLELSEAQRFVTWDVIASLPALTYSSVIHTVKLRRVTEDNHTFVQFTSDYSKDANQDVILDSKYKKTEFFKDLASITENRASQFLRRVDFSKVTKLSAGQVEEAWATFDTDKNGSLDQGEIEQLVEAILVKIADQQNSVFAAVANLFDEQVALEKKEAKEDKKDKKEEKGQPAAAPKEVTLQVFGGIKKQVKSSAKQLLGRLDKNKDGKIDKQEFTVLFPRWLEKKIQEGIRQTFL